MATRKPLIAGNWKCNLNHLEAIALVQKIAFALPAKYFDHVDVTVIPPFTDIRSVQTVVDGDKLLLTYGAQDLSQHDSGAYTGEVSGAFLAKLGCSFVVVGHSERRTLHGETDEVVLAKTTAALRHELTPIVCIGEGLEVREAGDHVAHNVAQLRGSLAGLTSEQIARVVVAYEPVWPSAPDGSPRPPTLRRCAARSARPWVSSPATMSRGRCVSSTAGR